MVVVAPLVGLGMGGPPPYVGWLCICRRQPNPYRCINIIQYYTSNTPITVTIQPLQMLRLDLNSLKSKEGRPFIKMSANCDVIKTWRTHT
jgi:hypothetical protein